MTAPPVHPVSAPHKGPDDPPTGRIMVYAGCMFAGKTTALIQQLLTYQKLGRRILAITHLMDLLRTTPDRDSQFRDDATNEHRLETHPAAREASNPMPGRMSESTSHAGRRDTSTERAAYSAQTRKNAADSANSLFDPATNIRDNMSDIAGICDKSAEITGDSAGTATHLRTHDGRWFPARALRSAAQIEACVRKAAAEIIGIDETQFFDVGIIDVCVSLRSAGRIVIAAGIHYNAWGRPFSPLPELMAIANSTEIMTVPCGHCGAAAQFTQRVTPVIAGNMIGGSGDYEPRCAACFRPLPA